MRVSSYDIPSQRWTRLVLVGYKTRNSRMIEPCWNAGELILQSTWFLVSPHPARPGLLESRMHPISATVALRGEMWNLGSGSKWTP